MNTAQEWKEKKQCQASDKPVISPHSWIKQSKTHFVWDCEGQLGRPFKIWPYKTMTFNAKYPSNARVCPRKSRQWSIMGKKSPKMGILPLGWIYKMFIINWLFFWYLVWRYGTRQVCLYISLQRVLPLLSNGKHHFRRLVILHWDAAILAILINAGAKDVIELIVNRPVRLFFLLR